jgi:hypothetical protein
MPDLDKLADVVDRLNKLLQDRQPGVSAWWMFLAQNVREFIEIINTDMKEEL